MTRRSMWDCTGERKTASAPRRPLQDISGTGRKVRLLRAARVKIMSRIRDKLAEFQSQGRRAVSRSTAHDCLTQHTRHATNRLSVSAGANEQLHLQTSVFNIHCHNQSDADLTRAPLRSGEHTFCCSVLNFVNLGGQSQPVTLLIINFYNYTTIVKL